MCWSTSTKSPVWFSFLKRSPSGNCIGKIKYNKCVLKDKTHLNYLLSCKTFLILIKSACTYMGWGLGHFVRVQMGDVMDNSTCERLQYFQITGQDTASKNNKFSPHAGLCMWTWQWLPEIIVWQAIGWFSVCKMEWGYSVDNTHVMDPVYRLVCQVGWLMMCANKKVKVIKYNWICAWYRCWWNCWNREGYNTQIRHVLIWKCAECVHIKGINHFIRLFGGLTSAALWCTLC